MRLALSLFLVAISATATSGLTIPSVSKADARALEEENAKKNVFVFARPKKVTIDTSTDDATGGIWDSDARSWTMNVTSPGAPSLNFGFTKYKLPNNAILTIRCNSVDSSVDCEDVSPIEVIGSKENSKSKEYWTPLLDCDAVIIELKYKTDDTMTKAPSDFTLSYINIGFRSIGNTGFSSGGEKKGSKDCEIDVACEEGVGWESEIRSVATFSIKGKEKCSGVMINNMKQDQTPYFLTAEHCGVNEKNTPSLVIYWNYENSRCQEGDDANKERNTQSGAEHLQTDTIPNSDTYMVRLNKKPPSSWKVTYAGWDNSPDVYKGPYACIHHPRTEEKKIAIGNDTMIVTGFFENSPFDTHVKVFWDVGTTEPGSSGSPLFNGAHRMIGQLHGGPANCNNIGTDQGFDYYGRFSLGYQAYAEWLDPNDDLEGGHGGINTYVPLFEGAKQYACLKSSNKKKKWSVVHTWQKVSNKYKMVLRFKKKPKEFKVSFDETGSCKSAFKKYFEPKPLYSEEFEWDSDKKKFKLELEPTENGSTPETDDRKTIIMTKNGKVKFCGFVVDTKKKCQERK